MTIVAFSFWNYKIKDEYKSFEDGKISCCKGENDEA